MTAPGGGNQESDWPMVAQVVSEKKSRLETRNTTLSPGCDHCQDSGWHSDPSPWPHWA